MILSLYIGWAILLIRGAKEPGGCDIAVRLGHLRQWLHAVLMVFQAFIYPNEHAHLWAGHPAAFHQRGDVVLVSDSRYPSGCET